MSVPYRAVLWNRQKRIYDAVLWSGVASFLAIFMAVGAATNPEITVETLLIRGFGSAAILLLHLVLCIGPLSRLDPRFLPLLYNRRHLGVSMFLLAAAHGILATVQFHALGDTHPLVSVLSANPRVDSVSQFPFQPLGFAALLILFAMAATSHDFWLANLTAPVWKALHMGVYVAYGLLILHVSLGVLQSETAGLFAVLLLLGVATVTTLHLVASTREARADRAEDSHGGALRELCGVDEIPEGRARVFPVGGERVAVFRHGGTISALSNVCQHQNGPLGEGRIVDGCVTCPWHGYQYDPASGRSPEPFTERVPTFRVEVRDGRVWIDPLPYPPGTEQTPARVESSA